MIDGRKYETTNWTVKDSSDCTEEECHFTFTRKMKDMPLLEYDTEILITSIAYDMGQDKLMGDFQRIPIREGSGAAAGLAAAAVALGAYLIF